MNVKYVSIYGVDCRNVRILETDRYGVRIEYRVKFGRKIHKCWIDYDMIGNSPILSDLLREYQLREYQS